LLVLHPESVKGAFANVIVDQLFTKLAELKCQTPRLVIIDSVYKTNYSTTDTGHMAHVDEHQYPLKYYKTSHAAKDSVLS